MHRARSLRAAAILVASLAPGLAAPQEAPLPPTPTDYAYARSIALGAFRGLPGGNDAIFHNAASMAARKKFNVELAGLMYRAGSDTDATMFGASVVDSTSGPVSGGFAYTYATTLGYETQGFFGGMTNIAVAFPLGGTFFVGGTLTYLNLRSPDTAVNCVTLNASAHWEMSKFFSAGVVGYNLVNTWHPDLLPRGLGIGVAAGPDQTFHVVGDWSRQWSGDGQYRDVWSAGAEMFLFDILGLRGGWLYDAGRRTQWWSAGLGAAYEGLGVEFAYRQSFGGATYRMLATSVRFLVPGM